MCFRNRLFRTPRTGSLLGAGALAAADDQGVPALVGGRLAVDPARDRRRLEGKARHEVHDVGVVGVVGVVVVTGGRVQPGDRGVDLVVVVADGVVKDDGEFEQERGGGDAAGRDLTARAVGAVGELPSGIAGVADEGGDLGGERRGALVESGEELFARAISPSARARLVKARVRARWAWAMAFSPRLPCCSASVRAAVYAAAWGMSPWAKWMSPRTRWPRPGQPRVSAVASAVGNWLAARARWARAQAASGAYRPPLAATCCMPSREAADWPRSRCALAQLVSAETVSLAGHVSLGVRASAWRCRVCRRVCVAITGP